MTHDCDHRVLRACLSMASLIQYFAQHALCRDDRFLLAERQRDHADVIEGEEFYYLEPLCIRQ